MYDYTDLFSTQSPRNNRFVEGIPRNPFPTYGMPDLDPLGGLRDPGYGMLYEPPRLNRPGYNVCFKIISIIYYLLFSIIL